MELFVKVLMILIIWIIGNIFISKVFKFIINKKDGIHIGFIGGITKLVYTLIIICILSSLFPETKSVGKAILTSSGLIVAVVGFAAQQVLSDIVSGLMLSWTKPFDIGEKITIADLKISGIIENMTIRHTVIRTYHNSRLLVPNSVINKSVVENSNYDSHYIGNYIEIPISYDSNIDKAIEIIEDIVSSHDLILDTREDKTIGKKVSVYVKDLCDNGIVLKTSIRTKDINDNFLACSEIRKEIKNQFDKNSIKICFKRIKVIN